MQARRDELKHSFYLHIIRTSIGAALKREVAKNEPLPERLADLLDELDDSEDDLPPGSSQNPPG